MRALREVAICTSDATGLVVFDGKVTLVPDVGTSFWAGDLHLVIQSFDYTPEGGPTTTYQFGKKTGQVSGEMVTCEGDFPGYHIVSHDVVVP